MSERNDLVAICKQLAITTDQEATNKTDIELLRSVVSRLQQLESTNLTNTPPETDGRRLKAVLAHNSLPDSLAFPARHRARIKLIEATDHWSGLKRFNDLLKQDHACRRQMLLNRLDCTIESFKWKGSEKNSNEQSGSKGADKPSLNDVIQDKYERARRGLREEPQVSIGHLLAIRETECDKLLNSVVSTRNIDCQVRYSNIRRIGQNKQLHEPSGLVNLKQIIIPDVPDRGGRPGEIRAPTKESFHQQNRARGGRGGRR